jgi:hypothetical protein
MASNGKRKTTMAKLNRESKLRERRMEKHARKDARKRTAADQDAAPSDVTEDTEDSSPESVDPAQHEVADVTAPA